MSDTCQPTVEEIDAELVWEEQELKEKMAEKRRIVQERKAALEKAAEEEKARKAEEEQLKAEADQKAEEEQLKAEAEWEAQEVREAAEKRQAEETQKAEELLAKAAAAVRKSREVSAEAERICLENKKRLDQGVLEVKGRMEAEEHKKAEEREKAKAGNGMMLATPADLSALEAARRINTENARLREGSHKPRVESRKATPTPMPKPKTLVNLACQVREDEQAKMTGHRGKNGDAVVNSQIFRFLWLF
jgi:hypothetical protein